MVSACSSVSSEGDRVVGVGQQCALEFGGSSGELGKHQHPAGAVDAVGCNEFLGDEVQSVAQWRDPHDVGGGVVRHHVFERKRPREEADRRPVQRRIASIDAAHRLLDVVAGQEAGEDLPAPGNDVEHIPAGKWVW